MKTISQLILQRRHSNLFILSYFLLLCLPYLAHGDLDERIEIASSRILQWPDSAELYIDRAELYVQHVEYEKALTDLNQSFVLGNKNPTALILQSKSQFGLGRNIEALNNIDIYLQKEGDHVNALRLKARILFDMGDFEKSADNYLAVISKVKAPLPKNYIETSVAYERSGNISTAISIVYEGIERLGRLHTLTERIIDLYIINERFDLALSEQKILIASSKRKESPLYNAALICLKAQQNTQAKMYLQKASAALEELPKHIRQNRAMQALKKDIAETTSKLK